MSRQTATVTFQALELKGSLLPASLLEEVSKFNRPKELLLDPHDYGLSRGERLRDRIDAAWVLTKELWEEYGNLKGRAGNSTAGLHFGLRLLREVFGWSDVEPCDGWQQGESRYPITHRSFDGAVPLILRGIDAGDLDRGSAQFGQEGRKRSPHSCLQECLNADDNANWGVLLSGDRLRLLHDNPSLVKPAYLAADLELLIEGESFDEFSVLWLLLHASRFQHPQTCSCVLDDWKQKAEESGERVLGALRGGVQSALESLGWGFLNHPASGALREALQSGQLSRQQFHEQLLRLVYRFLFLFTAEDRDLLFPREVDKADPRRLIYREGYSVSRLRELAIKRSAYEGEYGDLWELQRLVFQQLSIGNSPLGLPGLGGLFSLEQCPDLQGAELWNGPLLRAIKAIGWFDAGGTFTRVRYRDLNTEELGSVYEGLLELHPQLEQQGSQWQLSYGGGAGSDRKTTGSYYTPDALVQELIKSALVPVIEDRLSKAVGPAEQEKALLDIKVIDPACGSGHFLLAAARRLAVALAQLRAGDDQPSEDDRQHALRDVVAHCIYAVDKNPMAVELCKVAMWIEAIDPGKPLSFLDAHIQCGDSLVGVFDPQVLEEGIPDEAYKQLTGDTKTVCSSLKNENKAARKTSSRGGSNRGIQGSFDLSGEKPRSRSQEALQAIEAMPEATLAESAAKQAAYTNWLEHSGQDPEALAADLFIAAFFLAKNSGSRSTIPTTGHLLRLLGGQPIEKAMEEAVVQASKNFRFFHWHLRFGEVMVRGGFDCVLGNPPWEMPQVNEVEFFSAYPEIANSSGSVRKKNIQAALSIDPNLAMRFSSYRQFLSALANFKKYGNGKSSLKDAKKPNMFSMFTELAYKNLCSDKRALTSMGYVVPTSLLTDEGSSKLVRQIVEKKHLRSCFDFSNRKQIFKDVQGNINFSLIAITKGAQSHQPIRMICQLTDTKQLQRLEAFAYTVTADQLSLINPDTLSLPICSSQADVALLARIHDQVSKIRPEVRQGLFNMTSDSAIFIRTEDHKPQPGLIQLYESKNIGIYDSRYSDFKGIHSSKAYGTHPATTKLLASEKTDPIRALHTRYYLSLQNLEERISSEWHEDYFLVMRTSMSASQDSRSVRSTLVPKAGIGNSLAVLYPSFNDRREVLAILTFLNSIVIDFCAKKKVSGANLNGYIIKQLPLLNPNSLTTDELDFLCSRAAIVLARNGSLPSSFDSTIQQARKTLEHKDSPTLIAELDAMVAFLYGLNRSDLEFILGMDSKHSENSQSIDTFRVLRSQEIREFGEFRTLRLVLEAWDHLIGE
jgi:hypothetical protein